jgi:hypothetical protein
MTTKTIIDKVRQHGIVGSTKKAFNLITRGKVKNAYYRLNVRNAQEYHNPTPEELIRIEKGLLELGGVIIKDYDPSANAFADF